MLKQPELRWRMHPVALTNSSTLLVVCVQTQETFSFALKQILPIRRMRRHPSRPTKDDLRALNAPRRSLASVLFVGCCFLLLAGIDLSMSPTSRHIYPGNVHRHDRSNTIFVSVASYRDVHCGPTLVELFTKAAFPSRVRVGVVDQRLNGERTCTESAEANISSATADQFHAWIRSNVRVTSIDARHARGPADARHLAAQLRATEQFFLMIDSHTAFVRGWDVLAIEQLEATEERLWSKPLLSYHPPRPEDLSTEWADRDRRRSTQFPSLLESWFWVHGGKHHLESDHAKFYALCDCKFHPDTAIPIVFSREVRNVTYSKCDQEHYIAIPQPFTGGGFLFARMRFVDEVPFTVELPYVFHGEEIYLTARAFAKGWRSFRPCESIVSHIYERVSEPSLWTDIQESAFAAQRDRANQRLQDRLGLSMMMKDAASGAVDNVSDAIDDGLTAASVDAFWNYVGVDRRKWMMDSTIWSC